MVFDGKLMRQQVPECITLLRRDDRTRAGQELPGSLSSGEHGARSQPGACRELAVCLDNHQSNSFLSTDSRRGLQRVRKPSAVIDLLTSRRAEGQESQWGRQFNKFFCTDSRPGLLRVRKPSEVVSSTLNTG